MKKIKSDIEQYMLGLTKEGKKLTSRFSFPPEFIGFQGHFPEKKILPGVCQIQCVLSTLEKGEGKAVGLEEIVLAKYFSPVFPDEEVVCVVNDIAEADGKLTIKAAITKNASKVSELKLRITFNTRGSKA